MSDIREHIAHWLEMESPTDEEELAERIVAFGRACALYGRRPRGVDVGKALRAALSRLEQGDD